MENDPTYENELRAFQNADVRCTVVDSADQSWDIFYNIFYRLNTGSVPLSSQELRQVLNKGPFADYLMDITDKSEPIHRVLRCKVPDPRLRDAELILRFMAFVIFSSEYRGNLRRFLDDKMKHITEHWKEYRGRVEQVFRILIWRLQNWRRFLGAKALDVYIPLANGVEH